MLLLVLEVHVVAISSGGGPTTATTPVPLEREVSRRWQGLPRMIGRGCQYWQGVPVPAGVAASDWQGLPGHCSVPRKPDPDLPFFGLNPNSFGREMVEAQVGCHIRLGPRGVQGAQVRDPDRLPAIDVKDLSLCS